MRELEEAAGRAEAAMRAQQAAGEAHGIHLAAGETRLQDALATMRKAGSDHPHRLTKIRTTIYPATHNI